ncbi:MAG TPA: DUF1592 domain-containing protein, partial [Isosphaeraceae bacterium]|nr:DUF1592 domain-containing protein [Isosphaeraceae bacterium]
MTNRAIPLGILAFLLGTSSPGAVSADDVSSATADEPFTSAVRPILAARCFGCHAGKTPKAGLDLSRFDAQDGVLAAFRLWEKVIQKVKSNEMPPEVAKPLTNGQRGTLIDWHHRTFVGLEPRPGPNRPRRLTRTEYRNTLSDLFGIPLRRDRGELFFQADTGSIVEKLLPADPPGPSGFDNDSSVLSLGPSEFAKCLQIAEYVVDQLDSLPEPRQALFSVGSTKATMPRERARAILSRFAGRAFRRPVADAELAPFLAVFDAAYASPGKDGVKEGPVAPVQGGTSPLQDARFGKAIQEGFTAILVSPKFLYRLETARESRTPYRISDHELATRLAYFLWSTMPDDELFRLATEGRLHQDDVLGRQVERMLADPKSIALAENFGGQWLGYAELENPDRFRVSRSEESIKLLRSMYREPLYFFDDLVRSNRSLLELIDSRHTFLNPTLGYHYRLKGYKRERLIKDGGYDWPDPLRRVALDDPNRGGVLGMAAALVATSAPERTSPIRRGVWILDASLGQRPPDPPPNIPPLEEAGNGQRLRSIKEQMEMHRGEVSCARCHDA